MFKNKIKEIINSKYFNFIFIISINLIFFIICNMIFQLRYETVDDFTIMKIISKLDGTYSYYSIYIHPVLTFFIMLLYKTGININWYTFLLLTLQFISFSLIGIILLNKNKRTGTLFYLMIILTLWSNLLLTINYTSVAAILILSGIISILYYLESNRKRYRNIGLILITIGTMLRWKSIIISLPFYIIYVVICAIKKQYNPLKILFCIIVIFLLVFVSDKIIYNINPIYKEYTKFNDVRTYFFDSNVLDYDKYKNILKDNGWTYNDWKVFYTYSFADENYYNFEKLSMLYECVQEGKVETDKIIYTAKLLCFYIKEVYLIYFIGVILIILLSYLLDKNKGIISIYFLLYLFINYVLCYTKPVFRVIMPLFATTIIMMIYMIIDKKYNDDESKLVEKIKDILIIFFIMIYIILNIIITYNSVSKYNKKNFELVKEVINYTSNNKENAYVYPNVLSNISLAYSIYEKIPDNTFSNLYHMGDWDIYTKEYYDFKERYNIENIMTDLYQKDNLYIISGNVYGANNKKYSNHIDTIVEYIKEHYNEDIKYKVIKEFSNSIKIYKIYKEMEK